MQVSGACDCSARINYRNGIGGEGCGSDCRHMEARCKQIKARCISLPPKAQTEVYRELASGQIELELTRVNNEGASTSVIFSWPAGGGVVQDPRDGLPKGMTAVETLLKPGEWYVTVLLDGKQVMTMHKVISRDRQTMRQTLKGLDPQGRSVQQIQVLRRQSS